MTPLIDADLLLYECGYAGEYVDEETGEKIPRDFEDVKEICDQRIKEICAEVWATEEPLLFLTGDERLLRDVNRQRLRVGENPILWKPNFRFEKATTSPYKERKSNKPYHYHNLRAYVLSKFQVYIAWGMEADDAMAIYQTNRRAESDTVICSRDKDLRMVPGMQYGWECGGQAEYGPKLVTELGELSMPSPNKLVGEGLKFFYSQLITGDRVDTIPGLPKGGPVLAYKTLKDCESEEEMYAKVSELYKERIGPDWFDYFQEQSSLLWMVRELDEEGNPILYVPPVLPEMS